MCGLRAHGVFYLHKFMCFGSLAGFNSIGIPLYKKRVNGDLLYRARETPTPQINIFGQTM
jgi:hypothetical protein